MEHRGDDDALDPLGLVGRRALGLEGLVGELRTLLGGRRAHEPMPPPAMIVQPEDRPRRARRVARDERDDIGIRGIE